MSFPTAVTQPSFFTILPDSLIEELGLEAAFFLCRLASFIQWKKREGKDYDNGATWVWYSQADWLRQQLPSFTISSFRRVLADLKERGIVRVEQRNRSSWDHTNHYALHNEDYWLARVNNQGPPPPPSDRPPSERKDSLLPMIQNPTIEHTRIQSSSINLNNHLTTPLKKEAADEPPSSFSEWEEVREDGARDLAQEWLEHTQENRPELEPHQTLGNYQNVIAGACKHMGWRPETLGECFRLMKDDSFWGPHLIDPFGLMKKWDGGRKIERLSDQCKNSKKLKSKRDDYQIERALQNLEEKMASADFSEELVFAGVDGF